LQLISHKLSPRPRPRWSATRHARSEAAQADNLPNDKKPEVAFNDACVSSDQKVKEGLAGLRRRK